LNIVLTLWHPLQVEYKGKGYFSGKSHSFKATIQPPSHIKGSPYVVEGKALFRSFHNQSIHIFCFLGTWHTTSTVNATRETFHDVTSHSTPVQARPVSEQEPYESRKLWAVVAQGIREGDFDTASKDKSRIENEQREMRKREKEEGTSWTCRHYEHVDRDETYSRLVGPLLAGPFGKEAIKIIPAEEDGWVPTGTMPEWLRKVEEEVAAAWTIWWWFFFFSKRPIVTAV
jgi:oxysterol-binding protein-related protein 9/10/11